MHADFAGGQSNPKGGLTAAEIGMKHTHPAGHVPAAVSKAHRSKGKSIVGVALCNDSSTQVSCNIISNNVKPVIVGVAMCKYS